MTCYFVSRHAGAKDLSRRLRLDAVLVDHLDPATVLPGDRVVGTLPVHLAAEVIARGARYEHLEMNVPSDRRGRELDVDEMIALGARLVPYRVAALPTAELPARAGAAKSLRHFARLWADWEERRPGVPAAIYAAIVVAVAPAGVSEAQTELTQRGLPTVALACGLTAVLIAAVWDSLRTAIAKGGRQRGVADLHSAPVGTPKALRWARMLSWPVNAALAFACVGLLCLIGGAAVRLAVWLAIFSTATALLARLGKGMVGIRVVQSDAATVEPRRLIVMTLSDLRKRDEGGAHLWDALERVTTDATFDFSRACQEKLGPFPWQQNLRALAANFQSAKPDLRAGEVIVITSPESHGQFEAFERMVAAIAARSGVALEIERSGPCDFFDLTSLERGLYGTIRRRLARPDNDLTYADISIDVTAGPKLVSIAAAVITMGSELRFTYVEATKRVWALDAQVTINRSSS